jgi:hypothetical protein
MVSTFPDAAAHPEHAIDGARHADGRALHAAYEPRRLIRLHQQMEMIGLHREMEEAEAVPRSCAKGAGDCAESSVATKRGQPRPHAERDMRGMPWDVRAAPLVRSRTPAGPRLASGAAPSAAPGVNHELQLARSAAHLDCGSNIPS